MKQHITIDDLSQLNEIGKNRLRDWWNPEYGDWFAFRPYGCRKVRERIYMDQMGYDIVDEVLGATTIDANALPLLSIGQMIEFLDEHIKGWSIIKPYSQEKDQRICLGYLNHLHKNDELCDALWSAVKDILEKE